MKGAEKLSYIIFFLVWWSEGIIKQRLDPINTKTLPQRSHDVGRSAVSTLSICWKWKFYRRCDNVVARLSSNVVATLCRNAVLRLWQYYKLKTTLIALQILHINFDSANILVFLGRLYLWGQQALKFVNTVKSWALATESSLKIIKYAFSP